MHRSDQGSEKGKSINKEDLLKLINSENSMFSDQNIQKNIPSTQIDPKELTKRTDSYKLE